MKFCSSGMMIEGISSAIESFDPKPLGTQMLCLDLNICPVCRKWTAEPLFNGEDGIGRDADFHQRISCSQSASKAPAVTVYDDPAVLSPEASKPSSIARNLEFHRVNIGVRISPPDMGDHADDEQNASYEHDQPDHLQRGQIWPTDHVEYGGDCDPREQYRRADPHTRWNFRFPSWAANPTP